MHYTGKSERAMSSLSSNSARMLASIPKNVSGKGYLQSPNSLSSRTLPPVFQHSPSTKIQYQIPQTKSRDEFGQYPLHSHVEDDSDHIEEGNISSTHEEASQGKRRKSSLISTDLDSFPFVQINAYIWFCTASVQDEADASYILLSEFMQIGMSFLKVISPDFNEKIATKKASTLFKKYLPSFLTVSPKIGFEGFNMAMIDLATEELPNASTKERVIWLGKARTARAP